MATLAAVVAVPATASATDSSAVSKNSVAAVEQNVAKAQKATKRLQRAVRLNQSTVAKRQLKIARSQTAAASRTSRRMANGVRTGGSATNAAQALALAGTQYDTLLESLTGLVDNGPAQSLIAGSIQPTIAGKAQIIQILTSLLPSLPASAQPIVASIITALGAGDATEVTNLDSALNGGTLPSSIVGLVTQSLAMATQAIESAMALIQSSVLPMLPAAVQAPIGSILSQVLGTVATLIPSVLSTVTGLLDSVLGSLPFVGGASSSGGDIFGGLLSGLLGGSAGSTASLPAIGSIMDTITNLLSGLLGSGATGAGTSPVAGAGGIITSVMGLVNSILSGILGGGAVVPAS